MRALASHLRSHLRLLTAAAVLAVSLPATASLAAAPAAGEATAPVITKLDPGIVFTIGNDLVFIEGTGITDATSVLVDGQTVEVTDEGDGTISFFAPAHAVGIAQVQVVTPRGTSSTEGTANDLDYSNPCAPPTISSIAPSSGPLAGGTTVTIKGTSLSNTQWVLFGDRLAFDVSLNSDTELRVVAPPGVKAGPVELLINTKYCGLGGDYRSIFTYTAPAAALPKITRIAPNHGSALRGGLILITGTNLTGATSVKIGGVEALQVLPIGRSLLVFAPALPRGGYPVTVTTPAGPSAASSAGRYFSL